MVGQGKAPPVAAKKQVTSTIANTRDLESTDEGYFVQEETKESASQDIDDFERRLNGEKIAPRQHKSSTALKPVKMSAPPMIAPAAHVKVQPTSMTEEEEDRAEALKAVGELERFESKLPK